MRQNPFKLYEMLAWAQLQDTFTDEFARLKRLEYRRLVREYARPFYTSRVLAGLVPPSLGEAEWFKQWFEGIEHMVPLLSKGLDGQTPPTLGLDELGEVVSRDLATAPPLPDHPFVPAERRGDGFIKKDEDRRAGTPLQIRQSIEARMQHARLGPYAAATTFDTIADGREALYGDEGPTHPKMRPYATPQLDVGSNAAYEAAERAADVGVTDAERRERRRTDADGRAEAEAEAQDKEEEIEEVEDDQPFFGTFI